MAVFRFAAGTDFHLTGGPKLAPDEGRYLFSQRVDGNTTFITLWKGHVKPTVPPGIGYTELGATDIVGDRASAGELRASLERTDKNTLESIARSAESPRSLQEATAIVLQWIALDPDDKPCGSDGGKWDFLFWLFANFTDGEVHDHLCATHPDGERLNAIAGWDTLYLRPGSDGWAQPTRDLFAKPAVIVRMPGANQRSSQHDRAGDVLDAEQQHAGVTEAQVLRAYATMWNTLHFDEFAALLPDDFTYESQMVLTPLTSKREFLPYISKKLNKIKQTGATVFAEMGKLPAWDRPCVILAQHNKDNLVGLAFAEVVDSKLRRIDLCIAPSPQEARRSGEYPS